MAKNKLRSIVPKTTLNKSALPRTMQQSMHWRPTSTLRAAVTDLYRKNPQPLGRFGGLFRRNDGAIEAHPLHPFNLTIGRQKAGTVMMRNPRMYRRRPYW